MSFQLATVDVVDAEDLVRHVDFPAMQDGPLYRLMFPSPMTLAADEQEAILQWYITGLQEALVKQKENFRQIRTQEGTPAGFCGWTLDRVPPSEAQPGRHHQAPRRHEPLPETLDLSSWHRVSVDLRAERERVLSGLQNVCRLIFMKVHPSHQRQGLGSQLLHCLCEEFDKSQRSAFVLAAPAGVRLYTKFGFETVGVVPTTEGQITSMLRRPQSAQDTTPSPATNLEHGGSS